MNRQRPEAGRKGGAPPLRMQSLAFAGLRWAAAALGLAMLAGMLGAAAARPFLAPMAGILQAWLPEFRIHSFDAIARADRQLLLAAVQLADPLVIGRRVIYGLDFATAQMTLGSLWQPAIAAIATASAWPQTAIGRALASALACAAGLLLTIVLAPAMLAGMVIGDFYRERAAGEIVPFIVRLPRLLEDGGSFMLGIAAGACCVALAGLVARGLRRDEAVRGRGGPGRRRR